MRKSYDAESVISDKIVDEYEEDFEIEESMKPSAKKSAGSFGTGPVGGASRFNATQQQSDSSGGFEEKDEDDYF